LKEGNVYGAMVGLDCLGELDLDVNDLRGACDSFRRSLLIARELDDERNQSATLCNVACIAVLHGDLETAAQIWATIEAQPGFRTLLKTEQRWRLKVLEPLLATPIFRAALAAEARPSLEETGRAALERLVPGVGWQAKE